MVLRGAVAALALDAGNHLRLRQRAVLHRVGVVAAKAERHLLRPDFPAGRVSQAGRPQRLVSDRNIQTVQGFIKADEAFKILAVFLEDVRLSRFAQAKRIPDWHRQRCGTI